ncbi:uncharacterized protein LY79DRAFT_547063 [Colletotrichum navitas]|uniref:Uncharacterized protein n=1 Tax=Colletotrichum navitas TaxID=681940 RepID=A0AAD8V5P5_9PEZI|nr:uncharacterized protein LY79DRAFT_547063 [Colletotrichum navitas]KAK1595217.1 hypothetical protein LY79DRAFT_547063 [Colletotrichum navitas]
MVTSCRGGRGARHELAHGAGAVRCWWCESCCCTVSCYIHLSAMLLLCVSGCRFY